MTRTATGEPWITRHGSSSDRCNQDAEVPVRSPPAGGDPDRRRSVFFLYCAAQQWFSTRGPGLGGWTLDGFPLSERGRRHGRDAVLPGASCRCRY